jgi:hypothetical protein
MGLIAKIKRLVTGRHGPEEGKDGRDKPNQPDDRLGGGSPHDLGSHYVGSFRDE